MEDATDTTAAEAAGPAHSPKARARKSGSKQLHAGVDLGGTKIQVAVLRDQEIAGSSRVPTPQTDADDVIAAIIQAVKDSLTEAGAAPGDLAAVGIGTPGEIDADKGEVSLANNVPGFIDPPVPLGPKVSDALGGVTVKVNNDVRVAILGEFERGAGRPYTNFLGVFVGTGVGGGLILDGKLRTGRGAAGEIGHTVVKPGGRECACGRKGCLEAYAGRARLELRARELHDKGEKTDLFKIMEKKGRTRLSSGVWADALEKGDDMAKALIDDAVWALGIAVANAQNLLDVDAILIGGGLGDRLGKPFVARVEKAMHPHLFVDEHPPTMLTTGLGDYSGAVGAAVLAGG
ncbi:MAG TPA: ROK family protein [Actinomycetota bacterium]|nr:ROK family protein [Actinomycetota bacterium]